MILRKLLASTAGFVAGVMLFTTMAFADTYTSKTDSLNVRKSPSTNAYVMGQINKSDKVEVVDSTNNWLKIKYGNSYGWVYSSFMTKVSTTRNTASGSTVSRGVTDVTPETVYVTAGRLNLRSGAGEEYRILTYVSRGYKMTRIGKSGNWSRVRTAIGRIAWVSSSHLSTSPVSSSAPQTQTYRGTNENVSRNSDLRSRIVSHARTYLGVPYLYGGSSYSGIDCSGFTQNVMRNFGVYIQRVAASQTNSGYWIAKENLLPGDLVFFDTDGGRNYINHSGIVLGDGYFIHASSGGGRVMISNYNEGFYLNSYMTARRVVD